MKRCSKCGRYLTGRYCCVGREGMLFSLKRQTVLDLLRLAYDRN